MLANARAPLLKWILSLWQSEEKWLPLAIDATNIGQNFTVLSLHVLYQGCGIPVAWKIVKGTEKGSWKPHWLHIFHYVKDWIKSSYRDIKSDGWQWHKTRLREPARAERIWLAMAISTLWTVTVGSEGQQHPSKQFNDKPKPNYRINSQSELRQQPRKISCFLQGFIKIIADLVCGKGISLNGLFPRQSFSLNTS